MRETFTTRSLRSLLAAATLASLAAASVHAEVRAVEHASRGWTVEVEAAEGGRLWAPLVPHVYDEQVLNPGGDLDADGRPAVGVRPLVGLPEVVFSRASPQGYHMVFAQHDGERWARLTEIGRTNFGSDVNPILGYDDAGRSMLLWQRTVDVWAVMVAGLSIDGQLWDTQVTEPVGFTPIAMQSDGHEFYFVTLNERWGVLRFRLVAFPFPNGGPALPFPDDTLDLLLLDEVPTGLDMEPHAAGGNPPLGPRPSREPATLAGVTMQMHRHEATVWADWVGDDGTVHWIAFRDREVLDRGTEPFRGPGQVDRARERIRRIVEEL
jgi:hypothetical protein